MEFMIKAIERNPYFFGSYNSLGAGFTEEKNYPEAAKNFRKVIELNPKLYSGYSNLGQVLFLDGKYRESVNALEDAYIRAPKDQKPTILNYLGQDLDKLGEQGINRAVVFFCALAWMIVL